nr:MAG TPA_asm: Arc-like DNA binding domain protein [Caudoviricetes sp.]
MSGIKYVNAQFDPVTHAYIKAEAALHGKTVKDYIAYIMRQEMARKGYTLDPTAAKRKEKQKEA